MSMQGRVVWHDLNTNDIDKSRRFYSELFGWNIDMQGQWNFIGAANETQHFGTMMQLDASLGLPSHWLPYLTVENLDAAIAAVPGAGGKILLGKMPAGTTGHFSYVADPQAAAFALWQYSDATGKPEQDTPPPAGHFVWDELVTSDPAAAEKFYSSLIGFKTEKVEMPGMQYTLWLRDAKRPDGKPRQAGGMMQLPPTVSHPFWLSYVAVDDCDASAARAKSLGATIVSPPMNIPNVGRAATLLDSTQAAVAIIGPAK
jgi:predicted enzyme related to lactoylglutathione lyase